MDTLPSDLLRLCFEYSSVPQILRSRQCCSRWKSAADREDLWKFLVQRDGIQSFLLRLWRRYLLYVCMQHNPAVNFELENVTPDRRLVPLMWCVASPFLSVLVHLPVKDSSTDSIARQEWNAIRSCDVYRLFAEVCAPTAVQRKYLFWTEDAGTLESPRSVVEEHYRERAASLSSTTATVTLATLLNSRGRSLFRYWENIWVLLEDDLLSDISSRNGTYLSLCVNVHENITPVEQGEEGEWGLHSFVELRLRQLFGCQSFRKNRSGELVKVHPNVALVFSIFQEPLDARLVLLTAASTTSDDTKNDCGGGDDTHSSASQCRRRLRIQPNGKTMIRPPMPLIGVSIVYHDAIATYWEPRRDDDLYCQLDDRHAVRKSDRAVYRFDTKPALKVAEDVTSWLGDWATEAIVLRRFFRHSFSAYDLFPRWNLPPIGENSSYRHLVNLQSVTTCVTEGVEVTASTLLIAVQRAPAVAVYAYRIRLRLLPESPHMSVRLTHRRWEVSTWNDENHAAVEVIEGEGVIGYTPLLRRLTPEEVVSTDECWEIPQEDEEEPLHVFTYVSQTVNKGLRGGTMGGSFRFQPSEGGVPFDARVGTFQTAVPHPSLFLPTEEE